MGESKKNYNYIYVVGSESKERGRYHRSWSFHSSLEEAISSIYSWSSAETFYESGSYDYIVIQKVALDHPMPSMEMLNQEDCGQIWFEFVPSEINIPNEDIHKSIVRIPQPEQFKHIIAFF